MHVEQSQADSPTPCLLALLGKAVYVMYVIHVNSPRRVPSHTSELHTGRDQARVTPPGPATAGGGGTARGHSAATRPRTRNVVRYRGLRGDADTENSARTLAAAGCCLAATRVPQLGGGTGGSPPGPEGGGERGGRPRAHRPSRLPRLQRGARSRRPGARLHAKPGLDCAGAETRRCWGGGREGSAPADRGGGRGRRRSPRGMGLRPLKADTLPPTAGLQLQKVRA